MLFAAAHVFLLILATAAAAQAPRAGAQAREPQIPTLGYLVTGLDKPVEILVDTWGIPHIYAKSQYDAFFAQGFNAARDRLWQIDLWRRRGLGKLAEVFGASMVERDHAARLFLYRGARRLAPDGSNLYRDARPLAPDGQDLYRDARRLASDGPDLYREWLAYGSDTKRVAESFVAGINAYVKLIEQNPELLPTEFRLLDYPPATWLADDLLRIRAHGAWGNLKSEVRRAQIACVAGLQADFARRSLEPSQVPKIPEGLDLCDIRDDVLTLYRLAASDLAFAKSAVPQSSSSTYLPPFTPVPVEASDSVSGDAELGSGWVLSSKLSATNKPIFAIELNDRRVHALPAQRYLAHLSAPGLNVIGVGDPFLPGMVAGHNDRIAWGPVRYPIDQEDLVVEQLNAAGDSVKWKDRWDAIESAEESILVRGASPVKVTLRFTRHGPIVHEDKSTAFVVRAGWLEVGMAPAIASLGLMRSQEWDGFIAAMNRWGGAPSGQLYADVDGAIGWKAGGLAPERHDYDGLLPVPGDGRYEWAGFTDIDKLPSEINPARGWIVDVGQSPVVAERTSAKGLTQGLTQGLTPGLTPGSTPGSTPGPIRGPVPSPSPVSTPAPPPWTIPSEWSPRWRAERITELLDRPEKKSSANLFSMQSDTLSIPARRLVLLLKDTQTQDLRVAEAISLLRNWDFRLTSESPAAALFQLWYDRHLAPAMVALRAAPGIAKLIDVADSTTLFALLEQPAAKIQRDALFIGTLRQAIADLEQRQGTNWLRWSWGALHKFEFAHPLAMLFPKEIGPSFAARPRAGGAFTVAAAPYASNRASTLQMVGGVSVRMVFDLANWDNALALLAPGQSGDPRSKHYADLLDAWSKDAAHPLLFTRGAIEKATSLKILLNPAPAAIQ